MASNTNPAFKQVITKSSNMGMGRDLPKKFKVPDNPLIKEERLKEMKPSESYTRQHLELFYLAQMRNLSNRANRPGTPEKIAAECRAMMLGYALRVEQINSEYRRDSIKRDFVQTFNAWIMGKSIYNVPIKDYGSSLIEKRYKNYLSRTPWGQKPLRGDSIIKYQHQFIEAKFEYERQLTILAQAPPTDIASAWIYFKYIVVPENWGPDEYEADFNWWMSELEKYRAGNTKRPPRSVYEQRNNVLTAGDPGADASEIGSEFGMELGDISDNADLHKAINKTGVFTQKATVAEVIAEAEEVESDRRSDGSDRSSNSNSNGSGKPKDPSSGGDSYLGSLLNTVKSYIPDYSYDNFEEDWVNTEQRLGNINENPSLPVQISEHTSILKGIEEEHKKNVQTLSTISNSLHSISQVLANRNSTPYSLSEKQTIDKYRDDLQIFIDASYENVKNYKVLSESIKYLTSIQSKKTEGSFEYKKNMLNELRKLNSNYTQLHQAFLNERKINSLGAVPLSVNQNLIEADVANGRILAEQNDIIRNTTQLSKMQESLDAISAALIDMKSAKMNKHQKAIESAQNVQQIISSPFVEEFDFEDGDLPPLFHESSGMINDVQDFLSSASGTLNKDVLIQNLERHNLHLINLIRDLGGAQPLDFNDNNNAIDQNTNDIEEINRIDNILNTPQYIHELGILEGEISVADKEKEINELKDKIKNLRDELERSNEILKENTEIRRTSDQTQSAITSQLFAFNSRNVVAKSTSKKIKDSEQKALKATERLERFQQFISEQQKVTKEPLTQINTEELAKSVENFSKAVKESNEKKEAAIVKFQGFVNESKQKSKNALNVLRDAVVNKNHIPENIDVIQRITDDLSIINDNAALQSKETTPLLIPLIIQEEERKIENSTTAIEIMEDEKEEIEKRRSEIQQNISTIKNIENDNNSISPIRPPLPLLPLPDATAHIMLKEAMFRTNMILKGRQERREELKRLARTSKSYAKLKEEERKVVRKVTRGEKVKLTPEQMEESELRLREEYKEQSEKKEQEEAENVLKAANIEAIKAEDTLKKAEKAEKLQSDIDKDFEFLGRKEANLQAAEKIKEKLSKERKERKEDEAIDKEEEELGERLKKELSQSKHIKSTVEAFKAEKSAIARLQKKLRGKSYLPQSRKDKK